MGGAHVLLLLLQVLGGIAWTLARLPGSLERIRTVTCIDAASIQVESVLFCNQGGLHRREGEGSDESIHCQM